MCTRKSLGKHRVYNAIYITRTKSCELYNLKEDSLIQGFKSLFQKGREKRKLPKIRARTSSKCFWTDIEYWLIESLYIERTAFFSVSNRGSSRLTCKQTSSSSSISGWVMSSISSWERFRRFYKRNDILVWSLGLIVGGHLFWWEIQHNPAFVPKHERKHQLGPVKITYLDEYFKKPAVENSTDTPPSSK